MALMDTAEVLGFCRDVADCCSLPARDYDRLSLEAVLSVREFRSCFHAALSRPDELGHGWKIKGTLVAAAAAPEVLQAICAKDRVRDGIDAVRWFQEQSRAASQPKTTVPASRRARSRAKSGHKSILPDVDSASSLTDFQKSLLRASVLQGRESISQLGAFCVGMTHVAGLPDVARAVRASPDYLNMLGYGWAGMTGYLFDAGIRIFSYLAEDRTVLADFQETSARLRDRLLTVLPELSLREEVAFIPVHQALRRLVDRWRARCPDLANIADSSLLQSVQIAAAALHDDPVLILGETGTGKELSARAIHAMGRRAQGEFRAFNCASVPPALVESELFGYEKGSHFQADKQKIGLVEEASGGTLLLDEIGRASLEVQYALLRTLSDKVIRRVGGTKEIKVDVRFVFATSVDLYECVAGKVFLPDLHHRLRPDFALKLLPLNQRPIEDVKKIWEHVVCDAETELNMQLRKAPTSSHLTKPALLRLIYSRAWPGNVRQLKYVAREVVRRLGVGGRLPGKSVAEDVLEMIAEREKDPPKNVDKPVIPSVVVDERPQEWPSKYAVTEAVKASSKKKLHPLLHSLGIAVIDQVLKEECGSWKKAAERFGHGGKALRNLRRRWEEERASASPQGSPVKT